MSFLHLSLLAGLGVITIPIMLHLFGRSQPQLLDFPALRFVKETTQEQSMSWQLRHMLLLLLRVLLLAALALALARPRVHSAMLGSILTLSTLGMCATLATLIAVVAFVARRPAGVWLTAAVIAIALWCGGALWGVQALTHGPSVPSADQSAPVAAALIIDNGPTMSYRADNATHLDEAKEMGEWILEQLPLDSRVGVLSGAPVGSLALDPVTAKSQIKITEERGAHVDLLSSIRTALELVLASELKRKEVYVVTDLVAPSWSAAQPEVAKLLSEHSEEVLLQIIDVGTEAAVNTRLGDAVPDFETVPVNGEVTIEVDVYRSPDARQELLSVELLQEQIDLRLPIISDGKLQVPPLNVVDRQAVELQDSDSAKVKLTASDLAAGSHNFVVRLDRPDPLMIDNERYVTVMAQSQKPTLIVCQDPNIGQILQAIVDPSSLDSAAAEGTQIDQVRYVQLGNTPLANYAVVCLFDPPPLTSNVVQALEQHVQGGGGLFLILGPGLGTTETIVGNPLTQLLPGKLSGVARREMSQPATFALPVALSHPVFFAFGGSPDQVLWNLYPVYRQWTLDPLADNAQTLMELSDDSAAILVLQQRGRGQILTLTTPIPEVESRDRQLWNLLWASGDIPPGFALLLGSFRTLSGANQEQLNYMAGQPVSLTNDPLTWPSRYDLYMPQAQKRPAPPALEGMLNLGEFERPGLYRLRGQRGEPVLRSFSINVTTSDTVLRRTTTEELDERLGRGNYRVARDRNQVESSVGQARFGRELYPLLMVLVAGLFLAEQAMSNRFYKVKFVRARST
jgi:hypothetical protein